jgi:hypothetical protein
VAKPCVGLTPSCSPGALTLPCDQVTLILVAGIKRLDGYMFPCPRCGMVEFHLFTPETRGLLINGTIGTQVRRKLVTRPDELSEYHCTEKYDEDDFFALVDRVETSLLCLDQEPPARKKEKK